MADTRGCLPIRTRRAERIDPDPTAPHAATARSHITQL
jgi:hypothetical protein